MWPVWILLHVQGIMLQSMAFCNIRQNATDHCDLGHLFWAVEKGSSSAVQTREPTLEHAKGALHNVSCWNMGHIVAVFAWSGWVEYRRHEEGV